MLDMDKRWLAAGVVILLLVFFAGLKYGEKRVSHTLAEPAASEALLQEPEIEQEEKPGPIKVYVTGAVQNPGVYRLEEGARVYEAVEMAGGPVNAADVRNLQMAKKLEDEGSVDVPFQGESATSVAIAQTATVGGTQQASGLVNINTASVQELDQRLDGIGPALAERIVAYRQSNGPFQSIEQIKDVSGIGEKKFAAIRDVITVR